MIQKISLFSILFLCFSIGMKAQNNVGVNTTTPHSSAALDVSATDKGMLVPRMTAAQKTAIVTPATGLLVFQTDATAGFYYYDGTAWVPFTGGAAGATDSSQLQKITEGSFSGWRILGRDTANYGNIGTGALDLSFSSGASTTNGATGDYSTALGLDSKASGFVATAMGSISTASGSQSTAMGASTTASGTISTAMGANTTASGTASTAMGQGTNASGTYSTAMGQIAIASGYSSTAMGSNTTASGNNSTAMGYQTTASGGVSSAMGSFTTASGDRSTAMGTETKAKSFAETAIGFYNDTLTSVYATYAVNDSNRVFTVGNGNSSARKSAFVIQQNGNVGINRKVATEKLDIVGSIKIEDGTQGAGKVLTSDANGKASWQTAAGGGASELQKITEGGVTGWRILGRDSANYGNIGDKAIDLSYSNGFIGGLAGATGLFSFATGTHTIANGINSTALGNNTKASGDISFSAGNLTIASGSIAFAAGTQTIASGNNSTAMGVNTIASGNRSTAMGSETKAKSYGETAIGFYNDTLTSVQAIYSVSDSNRIFTVGNGTSSNSLKTAFVIQQNGNIGINRKVATEKLDIVGSIKIEDGTQGAGKVLTSDANGKASWQTAASGGASELQKITEGGNTGWRILGRNPASYGNIGSEAVDLSYNNSASTTWGATGQFSIAMGNASTASGSASTAMGATTTASGTASLAMGSGTTASGVYSTALGANATASGISSTAMGYQTTASGEISTAMGFESRASGSYSTAMGNNSFAKSYGETVIGVFNDTLTSVNALGWSGGQDRVFTVGAGSSPSARKSVFVIEQNGSVKIGPNGSKNKNVFSATQAIGSNGSVKKTITVTHGKTFTGTQVITATVANEPGQTWTDVFCVSITEITSTSFKAVVYRVDGGSWGQNPVLHYTITEQ